MAQTEMKNGSKLQLIHSSSLFVAMALLSSSALGQTEAAPAEAAPAETAPAEATPAEAAPAEAAGAAAPAEAAPAEAAPAEATPSSEDVASSETRKSEEASEDSYASETFPQAATGKVTQDKFLFALYWDMGMPLGSTADWVSGFSTQGFVFDLRYYAFGNLGLGGSLSWNTFDQKDLATNTLGDATLTGTQVHELSTTPMTGKVFYAWKDQKVAIPYMALGLGGSRVLRRIDAGIYRTTLESWHWTFVPEVGVELPIGYNLSALGVMRFNYLFKTSDAPEQLYLSFSVGLGFR